MEMLSAAPPVDLRRPASSDASAVPGAGFRSASSFVRGLTRGGLVFLGLLATTAAGGQAPEERTAGYPDLSSFRQDLTPPTMTNDAPAAGKRVRLTLPRYRGTDVHLSLYLPTDWEPGRRYPVIVEYAGNGGYRSKHGDVSTGRVEDSSLGFGLAGPQGTIWACLPYVDSTHQKNEIRWWGDLSATVAFCKEAVALMCREFGGDPRALVICGFSRGAIACNVVGLHDDEIAALWRVFIPVSHYDGARTWPFGGSDPASAHRRLLRLRGRPVLVMHEVYDITPGTYTIVDTINYLAGTGLPLANFKFQAIGIRNHTDRWTLFELPERKVARDWLAAVLTERP
jgi:hypothetical protein